MQNETTLSIPGSQNKAAGFWGRISQEADASAAWQRAFSAIAKASAEDDIEQETIRAFLDSRYGWRLACSAIEQTLNRPLPLEEAIETAVEEWASWTITRPLEIETGMPRGCSYLNRMLERCWLPSTYAAFIPDSQNKTAGFWSTIRPHADAATGWRWAFWVIAEVQGWHTLMPERPEVPSSERDTLRVFLDSDYGRDLAEAVIDQLQDTALPLAEAIKTAVKQWEAWRITRTLESETGMPRGYCYLNRMLERCQAPAIGT